MKKFCASTEGNPALEVLEGTTDLEDEQQELMHLFGAKALVHGKFSGYRLKGRWLKDDRYGALRNAAWLVRNSRVGQANNPLALKVAVVEVQKLIAAGEGLPDVIEALCELLVHP